MIGLLFSILAIENKFFKRKNSIVFGLLISSIVYIAEGFLFVFHSSPGLMWTLLTILRILAIFVFTIFKPLTAESYDTHARAAGNGLAHTVCRIAGMIMPILNEGIRKAGIEYIFFFCGFLTILSPILVIRFLKETFGKNIN